MVDIGHGARAGRLGGAGREPGTVGVVGLGAMGEPIARNLLAAGFDVVLHTRSPAKADPFRDDAEVVGGAHELFERSDIVVLTVPGEAEIDDVLGRSGGRLQAPVRDTVVVNASTVAPAFSAALQTDVERRGGSYVEAPLSGSRKPAEAGTLVVIAAARDEMVLDLVQPLFDAIGKATLRCGAPPEAMRMKLANNLLLITLLLGYAQAFTFARAVGLDPRLFADLVAMGPMANDVFQVKARMLLDREFESQASITNVHKDTRLIAAETRRHGIHAPYAQVNCDLLAAAIDDGWGADDIIGVAQLLERATAAGPISSAVAEAGTLPSRTSAHTSRAHRHVRP